MGFTGLFTSGTNNANGGLNMADFVLGLPATFRQGGSQINNQSINAVGLYVGDVWRISRNVTLNYGMRWEPYLAAKDANGFNDGVQSARTSTRASAAWSTRTRRSVWCSTAIPASRPTARTTTTSWRSSRRAPASSGIRRANNVQTIRAGIGIYYDSPKLWAYARTTC